MSVTNKLSCLKDNSLNGLAAQLWTGLRSETQKRRITTSNSLLEAPSCLETDNCESKRRVVTRWKLITKWFQRIKCGAEEQEHVQTLSTMESEWVRDGGCRATGLSQLIRTLLCTPIAAPGSSANCWSSVNFWQGPITQTESQLARTEPRFLTSVQNQQAG